MTTPATITYHSVFISYNHQDEDFADKLYMDLRLHQVDCWKYTEDVRIGDKIRQTVDDAIRTHQKLLLILSQYSVESNWVEKEVETAFARESRESRLILFPIRLDTAINDTTRAWAADIRNMRNIGDFIQWQEPAHYQKALTRLLRDLTEARP